MKIEYDRLFKKIKSCNLTQKDFKEQTGISGNTLNKILHNENITTDTICRICDYFHCMPDEIMEFIPNEDYEEKKRLKRLSKPKLPNYKRN